MKAVEVAIKASFTRNPMALLAIVAVLGVVWLPAEHIHATDDHGDHEEVVHRHVAPHHETDSGATFDHDATARYLTSPFIVPNSPTFVDLGHVMAGVQPALCAQDSRLTWTLLSLRIVRVHDPPWTASLALRAPPALAHLS